MPTCTFITFNVAENTLNNENIVFFKPNLCTCWTFIAPYKNSKRFYRDGGPNSFPKELRVPRNVDASRGRMIDEGILIESKEYKLIQ